MKLDDRDRQILAILQRDGRISNQELAAKVEMSSSACWRKVRALEEAGVIERYGAVLNPAGLGLSFAAVVHVQLTRHDPAAMDGFIRDVSRRKEIQSCYATTGKADYHMVVRCEDIDAYNRFLEDFLFRLPAVQGAQTNVVLKEIKSVGVA